jgi:hypothetical protein
MSKCDPRPALNLCHVYGHKWTANLGPLDADDNGGMTTSNFRICSRCGANGWLV